MKDKVALLICAMVCVTLIICGILFWPTFYRYDKLGRLPVRINRITGYTEILSPSGWSPAQEKNLQPIPKDEIAKIEIRGFFDGKGSYEFTVYNGSAWTIKRIRLFVGLKDGNGKKVWERIYEKRDDILPFSTGSSSIKLMDYAPETSPYTLQELEAELARRGLPKETPKESNSVKKEGHWGKPIDNSEMRIPEVRLEQAFGYKNE
jgi:hypothetical protein